MNYLALAALELVLLGLLSGIAGTLIVLRRRSFFAVALSHATFPGGVVFAVLGYNLLLGQALFALVLVLLMTLLSRTRFYKNGHRFSGLDPRQLGAVYRGRAQFREPVIAASGAGKKVAASQKEAQRRQTIAERKAAEAAGLTDAAPAAGKDS